MKAKLIFDLTDADDCLEHQRCMKSLDMASVLWELDTNSYKNLTKYDTEDRPEGYFDGVDAVFKHFRDLLQEHNINPDKYIR